MKKTIKAIEISVILIIIGLILVNLNWKENVSPEKCYKTTVVYVRGNSLKGVLSNNQKVLLLKDYYKCNKAHHNDIIAYNYSNRILAKIIKLFQATVSR